MDKNEIWEKMMEICRDVFENDELILTEQTCAADVEEWDSLTHLTLISDLEEEFEISFTLAEISETKDLGGLLQAVMRHLAA